MSSFCNRLVNIDKKYGEAVSDYEEAINEFNNDLSELFDENGLPCDVCLEDGDIVWSIDSDVERCSGFQLNKKSIKQVEELLRVRLLWITSGNPMDLVFEFVDYPICYDKETGGIISCWE